MSFPPTFFIVSKGVMVRVSPDNHAAPDAVRFFSGAFFPYEYIFPTNYWLFIPCIRARFLGTQPARMPRPGFVFPPL